MKSRHINDSLIETMTTAIASWMEHGEVNVEKFPQKYHQALHSQANIGWNHLFMGRISQEWLQLYEDAYKKSVGCTKSPHYYDGFVWGASIIEIILRQMILLWESRNKDIHGHTDKEAETLRKEKLIEKARDLHSQKCDCRPSDAFLFHDDFNSFTTRSTADQILAWISSRKRAIKNSVKQWKKHNNKGVRSIISWLLQFSDDNNSRYQNLQRSMCKRHELDGR